MVTRRTFLKMSAAAGRRDRAAPGRLRATRVGRPAARWHARPGRHRPLRARSRDPSGHAPQRREDGEGGQERRLVRHRGASVPAGDRARAADDGVELRVGRPPGHVQLPRVHGRGEVAATRGGALAQRAGRRRRQVPAPPAAGRPDPALGEPAGRERRPRLASGVPLDPRLVPGTRADRHAPARRREGRRRERRVRRGVVPARCDRHPARVRAGRHVARLLRAEVARVGSAPPR